MRRTKKLPTFGIAGIIIAALIAGIGGCSKEPVPISAPAPTVTVVAPAPPATSSKPYPQVPSRKLGLQQKFVLSTHFNKSLSTEVIRRTYNAPSGDRQQGFIVTMTYWPEAKASQPQHAWKGTWYYEVPEKRIRMFEVLDYRYAKLKSFDITELRIVTQNGYSTAKGGKSVTLHGGLPYEMLPDWWLPDYSGSMSASQMIIRDYLHGLAKDLAANKWQTATGEAYKAAQIEPGLSKLDCCLWKDAKPKTPGVA